MLQSLVDGKESSQLILIEDNVDVSGRSLLKAFIQSLATRHEVVHVLLYEVCPSKFLQGLPQHIIPRLKIHDGASDLLGWHDTKGSAHPTININTDLCQHLHQHSDVSSIAIVIDTLDQLLLHRSVTYTCQTLHRIQNSFRQAQDSGPVPVVAGIHSDSYDDVTLGFLRHYATSQITLVQPKDANTCHFATRALHRRVTGRVLQSPDPMAGITFNLSLTESERTARSQLILPYMRKPAKENEVTIQGSAKIFYQPDDADDFDEEDPDDDLDI